MVIHNIGKIIFCFQIIAINSLYITFEYVEASLQLSDKFYNLMMDSERKLIMDQIKFYLQI